MKYFVSYNCKFTAMYKSIKACLNFINRKGWKNDEYNMLYIVDEDGEEYDPVTGEKIQEDVVVEELTSKEFDTLVDLIHDNPDMEIDPNETKDGVVVLRFPKINGCFMCLRSDFDKACDYMNGIDVEF